MSKIVYLVLLFLSFLLTLINGFAIVNVSVSIKYEIENPSDCISSVTGIDLCSELDKSKLYTLIFGLVFMILLVIRKWIVKKVKT